MDNRTPMYEVIEELQRAQRRFPALQSAHEGLAVIREEYLELEGEVFHGSASAAYEEAKQLAAMALRYMVDIGNQGRNVEVA
jgi:hypothetical protein